MASISSSLFSVTVAQRTLEAGSGIRVTGPAALHEAEEACTGGGPTAGHGSQVWTQPPHHPHHDLKDVILT